MNSTNATSQLRDTLALPQNAVHLWCINLGAVGVTHEDWLPLLPGDEQARAQRFIAARARQHFLVTRGVLRIVLAAYLLANPKDLIFQNTAKGKPVLASPFSDSGINFNVSHSGELGLLAFSRKREVGVDVEFVRDGVKVDAIANRFFSAHEQRQLANIGLEEKCETFFRCWTRKESFIKAKGEGLSLPLDQFDVSLERGDLNCLLATRPDPAEAARWLVSDISVPSGYVAALCVTGRDWHLERFSNDTLSLLLPRIAGALRHNI